MTHVVIDTNVLVSALLSKYDDAATVILIEKLLIGELVPLYSSVTMNEYHEVLHRKKFRFDTEQIDYILSVIRHYGLMIEPSPSNEVLPDMSDLPFYELATEMQAKSIAYLVTGNKKHFPERSYIVTPSEMLSLLETLLI